MLRQHQARSAILLSISRKSTVISNYFLNFLSKTQLNQFNQVIVLSEVLIFITADGCAFYSISEQVQPLLEFIFKKLLCLFIYSAKSAFFIQNFTFLLKNTTVLSSVFTATSFKSIEHDYMFSCYLRSTRNNHTTNFNILKECL